MRWTSGPLRQQIFFSSKCSGGIICIQRLTNRAQCKLMILEVRWLKVWQGLWLPKFERCTVRIVPPSGDVRQKVLDTTKMMFWLSLLKIFQNVELVCASCLWCSRCNRRRRISSLCGLQTTRTRRKLRFLRWQSVSRFRFCKFMALVASLQAKGEPLTLSTQQPETGVLCSTVGSSRVRVSVRIRSSILVAVVQDCVSCEFTSESPIGRNVEEERRKTKGPKVQRGSWIRGKERAERVLASAISIDGRKEWTCKFCSEG